MQYLVAKLEEHTYVRFTITKCQATTVEDIFWTHPEYFKLFNNLPTVLIMDSTYKTKMYKMSLFEIVRVTSTDMTYYVGFAFLTSKKEENFTWVLEVLFDLL